MNQEAMQQASMSELHLQSSQMATFMQCPRKWYYAYHLWRGVEPNAAMLRGTVFHHVCELYYRDNIAFADLQDHITQSNPEYVPFLEEVLPAFLHYRAKYESSPYEFVHYNGKPAIELEFRLELTDGIYYHGKFDSLRERDGKKYIFDWKVTKMALSDWYFKPFELAYQTFSYSFVGRQYFDNLDGFFIDAVQINNGKQAFMRKYFPLLTMFDEFVSELIRSAEWIREHRHNENYFEHRYTACVNKYNRLCEYADVCTAKPERREAILASNLFVNTKPIYDFTAISKEKPDEN